MQTTTRLKEGDIVQVMAGRSKGKSGKILTVNRKSHRLLIEKVNLVKRHVKPNKTNPQGGIIEKEATIHWSSVLVVCGKCAKPVRIKVNVVQGARQRACGKCSQPIGN